MPEPRQTTEPLTRRPPATRARAWMLLALAPAVLGLYACGESKEQKAEKSVCAARADIKTRITTLQSVTPSVASVPQIKTEATAIVEDLKKIREAIPDLAPARKEEATKATELFAKQAGEAVEALKGGTSLSSVETQVKAALNGLVKSYESALAPIKCS